METFDDKVFVFFKRPVKVWELVIIGFLVLMIFVSLQLCIYKRIMNKLHQYRGEAYSLFWVLMPPLEDSRNELEASLTRIANGYMANLRMLKIYYSPEFSGLQKARDLFLKKFDKIFPVFAF